MPDISFQPLLFGGDINVYSVARAFHEAYGVKSIAFGKFAATFPCAYSAIIDYRPCLENEDPDVFLQNVKNVAGECSGKTVLVIGCGESRLPLRAVTVTSVLNICLDLLLVGPMGVAGAALATALSQVAGCAYMLRYLRRTLLAGPFRLHMLQREWFVEIMRLSVPNTVQQSAGTAITVVRQSLLGPLGVAAIAGFSSAGKISQLLLMPVFSLMQSLVVFIAQNRAVGQLDRAEEGVREARRILLCYTALVVAVCALGSRLLLGLFTRDQEAIRYGALLLSRECWSYPLTNLRHLQEARLRGRQQMGRFLTSNMVLIAMSMAGCLLLVPRMGFPGFYWAVYLSAPLGLALSTILARWNRQSSHSFS